MGVPGWPGTPQPVGGRTIVRQYRGSVEESNIAFSHDAARLAQQGYVPVSQSYTPGSYGCGAFLIALLLCILVIGIFIFIFMLIVKPAGTLTVTYTLQPPPQMAAPPAPPSAAPDLASRLRELDDALAAGLISPEQHAAKRAEMLQRF